MTDTWLVCNGCDTQYRFRKWGPVTTEGVPLHRNRDRSYGCPQCGAAIDPGSVWQAPRLTVWDRLRSAWSRIKAAVQALQ